MFKKNKQVLLICLVLGIAIIVTTLNKDDLKLIERNPKEMITSMVSDGPGIYIFGFEDCPWCKDLYPILNGVLIEENEQGNLVDIYTKDFTAQDRMMLKKTESNDIIVPLIVMISKDGFFSIV